jgi:hypothetical protein
MCDPVEQGEVGFTVEDPAVLDAGGRTAPPGLRIRPLC